MSKNPSVIDCKPAISERVHWLEASEVLPGDEIACPPLDACLWNAHPRVYMKISDRGEAYCPYCSTIYRIHGGS